MDIDKDYTGEGIYREIILDHYKNPRNYGLISEAEIKHREYNPLCGDEIIVYLKLDDKKNLKDIRYIANGCAISRSAASILSEEIKGKSLEEIKNLTRDDVIKLLQIPIGPVRVRCAVLSLVAIRDGIKEFENGTRISN